MEPFKVGVVQMNALKDDLEHNMDAYFHFRMGRSFEVFACHSLFGGRVDGFKSRSR
jgi:hypothetical protein